ncbi:MAG: YdcF family protein [Candidatus Competibacteraceae bacterium]
MKPRQSLEPALFSERLRTLQMARRRRHSRSIGLDGWAMLVLSIVLIGVTAGLTWLWQLGRVYRIARYTPCMVVPAGSIVVLGQRLQGESVGWEYAQRLERAHALYERNAGTEILLVGGKTGASRYSEAEQGRRFLAARGVPEHCLRLEDRSRHTLENLRHARVTLGDRNQLPFVLVTSRYHLARSQALALGLNLRPRLCAAEERLRLDAPTLLQLLREAFYLHWYIVGKTWSQWTGNRKSLGKIT